MLYNQSGSLIQSLIEILQPTNIHIFTCCHSIYQGRDEATSHLNTFCTRNTFIIILHDNSTHQHTHTYTHTQTHLQTGNAYIQMMPISTIIYYTYVYPKHSKAQLNFHSAYRLWRIHPKRWQANGMLQSQFSFPFGVHSLPMRPQWCNI